MTDPTSVEVPHAGAVVQVDLLIVGAGPVGLFGAYYAGVRTMSIAVVDSLEEPGGQITAMYPEKAIFDVAGFPAVKGRDLVTQLLAQAARSRRVPARPPGGRTGARRRTGSP